MFRIAVFGRLSWGGHVRGVVVLKRNFCFYPAVTESLVIFKLDYNDTLQLVYILHICIPDGYFRDNNSQVGYFPSAISQVSYRFRMLHNYYCSNFAQCLTAW